MDFEKLIQKRNQDSRFTAGMGIQTTEIREGYAKGEVDVTAGHLNTIGSVHGGCIFSLADTIAGSAAVSRGETLTTVSGNINYLSPALHTRRLTAEAREIKRGKNICVYEVDISDETGRLLAKASFTYFNIRKSNYLKE